MTHEPEDTVALLAKFRTILEKVRDTLRSTSVGEGHAIEYHDIPAFVKNLADAHSAWQANYIRACQNREDALVLLRIGEEIRLILRESGIVDRRLEFHEMPFFVRMLMDEMNCWRKRYQELAARECRVATFGTTPVAGRAGCFANFFLADGSKVMDRGGFRLNRYIRTMGVPDRTGILPDVIDIAGIPKGGRLEISYCEVPA